MPIAVDEPDTVRQLIIPEETDGPLILEPVRAVQLAGVRRGFSKAVSQHALSAGGPPETGLANQLQGCRGHATLRGPAAGRLVTEMLHKGLTGAL